MLEAGFAVGHSWTEQAVIIIRMRSDRLECEIIRKVFLVELFNKI